LGALISLTAEAFDQHPTVLDYRTSREYLARDAAELQKLQSRMKADEANSAKAKAREVRRLANGTPIRVAADEFKAAYSVSVQELAAAGR
jgi:hypothetical protein